MLGQNRSIAHSSTRLRLLALELDRELTCFQLVDQLDAASCLHLLPLPRPLAGSQAGQLAQLVVARRRENAGEALARSARFVEPAGDQALDRCVELVGRHAPEERLADRGLGPEAAAHEDVVGLPAHAALVARGRALEAEVADPVLGAGVRAAVEVEPQVGDLVAEARLEPVDQPRRGASSSRRPRSCSAARRCRRSSCRAPG